jgi:hypothetical protein
MLAGYNDFRRDGAAAEMEVTMTTTRIRMLGALLTFMGLNMAVFGQRAIAQQVAIKPLLRGLLYMGDHSCPVKPEKESPVV